MPEVNIEQLIKQLFLDTAAQRQALANLEKERDRLDAELEQVEGGIYLLRQLLGETPPPKAKKNQPKYGLRPETTQAIAQMAEQGREPEAIAQELGLEERQVRMSLAVQKRWREKNGQSAE